MNTEAISERVKSLLRLARCKAATPAEAANALNRALEMIEKHQIDVASLDLDAPTENLICDRIKVGQRVSLIKRLVTNILLNHFKVKCIYSRTDLVVVGFEQDVAMAGYVFHFLVGACNRSVNTFAQDERRARRKATTGKRKNYIQGWMYGVTRNLRKPDLSAAALGDSRTAIVLAERAQRVKAHFDELYPPDKTVAVRINKPRANHRIITRGFIDGRSTTISQPLANSEQQPLLLT